MFAAQSVYWINVHMSQRRDFTLGYKVWQCKGFIQCKKVLPWLGPLQTSSLDF